MWYIILFYIVIFKLPVSANQFYYRSVADMTNIHRTKVMVPVPEPAPPEPGQLWPNQKPTTCIAVGGRYERGMYRDQEIICNTVQRRPETRRQATPTTQMLRYSRVPAQMPPRQLGPAPPGMIKPQMMLPKQSNHQTTYHNPQNVARTPRQVMMPKQILRVSQLPAQQPTHAVKRQPDYNPNEGNRGFQEYHLFPQVLPTDNQKRDHEEYQSFPQPVFLNDEDNVTKEFYPKAQGSTSTAAPIPSTQTWKSTTSTMPPFPGGFIPGGDGISGEAALCGGKARCSHYHWTTNKKTHKRTTEMFLLWTP